MPSSVGVDRLPSDSRSLPHRATERVWASDIQGRKKWRQARPWCTPKTFLDSRAKTGARPVQHTVGCTQRPIAQGKRHDFARWGWEGPRPRHCRMSSAAVPRRRRADRTRRSTPPYRETPRNVAQYRRSFVRKPPRPRQIHGPTAGPPAPSAAGPRRSNHSHGAECPGLAPAEVDVT